MAVQLIVHVLRSELFEVSRETVERELNTLSQKNFLAVLTLSAAWWCGWKEENMWVNYKNFRINLVESFPQFNLKTCVGGRVNKRVCEVWISSLLNLSQIEKVVRSEMALLFLPTRKLWLWPWYHHYVETGKNANECDVVGDQDESIKWNQKSARNSWPHS